MTAVALSWSSPFASLLAETKDGPATRSVSQTLTPVVGFDVAMSDDNSSVFVTHTITLQVDDEEIPVQLEEPGPITRMKLASNAQAPVSMQIQGVNEEALEMVLDSVAVVSDFPPELVNELPNDQFIQLVESVTTVLRGEKPTVDNRDPKNTASTDARQDVFGDDTTDFF